MFHAIVQINHPADVAASPAVYLPGLFRSRGERNQDAVAAVHCVFVQALQVVQVVHLNQAKSVRVVAVHVNQGSLKSFTLYLS